MKKFHFQREQLQEKATNTSTLPEPNLASTENAVPDGDIGLHENLNVNTRPHQNIVTYKQGPANIKKNPIDG